MSLRLRIVSRTNCPEKSIFSIDQESGASSPTTDFQGTFPLARQAPAAVTLVLRIMAIETYLEYTPQLAEDVFVAASGDVIGRVTLGRHASVWYNATLRGDINEIVVGDYSNIQDNAVLHLSDDFPCIIEDYVTVGHSAIVHAATVKTGVLVGMGAIILDGAIIGERSIIGAGALVTGGVEIPPDSLVLGSPGKVVRPLTEQEKSAGRDLAEKYVRQSRKFLARNRAEA